MRAVIQRVKSAEVKVKGILKGKIETGLLVLVGIEDEQDYFDIAWLSNKLVHLRIFDDKYSVPNLSVKEVNGDVLIISQFTLFAATKKGNRPGYTRAARPEVAIPVYEAFIHQLEADLGKTVQVGVFGADMDVSLLNNGPVTIIIDTKNKDL